MYILEQKYENYHFFFLSENFHFLVVKFSVYLNRRVYVMGRFFGNQGYNVFFCFFHADKEDSEQTARVRKCPCILFGLYTSSGTLSHIAVTLLYIL